MGEHLCAVCGFLYDQTQGYFEAQLAPQTEFEDLPENWVCPICGVGPDMFITVT